MTEAHNLRITQFKSVLNKWPKCIKWNHRIEFSGYFYGWIPKSQPYFCFHGGVFFPHNSSLSEAYLFASRFHAAEKKHIENELNLHMNVNALRVKRSATFLSVRIFRVNREIKKIFYLAWMIARHFKYYHICSSFMRVKIFCIVVRPDRNGIYVGIFTK